VAVEYLERSADPAPPPATSPVAATVPAPARVPPATLASAPPPAKTPTQAVAAQNKAPTIPPPPAATAPTPPNPVVPIEPASPRTRIVSREGVVRFTRSVQAPTRFELRATDTGRLLNWLRPGNTNLNLGRYRGSRVIVTGEEQMESRWLSTPMIEVQTLRMAP